MIYVHIPFCRSFCTYCGFYSEIDARCGKEAFARALRKEVVMRSDEISDEVNTLYIGGGTPSVLPLSVFAGLTDALREAGHGGPYDEFTVEVNPEDVVEKGEAYIEGLLKLGVNRISMGVQSFDDHVLKFMNRRHDAATARKAYAVLENAGVRNISIDLIFGLPQLSDAQWSETLEKALGISASGTLPKHISSYQLSVEPESALASLVERGEWTEAPEDLCRRQYEMLCKALGEAGYHHYEISNFAREGFEAKHNGAYWRHVPYVGFGPGAHSLDTRTWTRRWNREDLKGYVADPSSVHDGEKLTREQVVMERIMLGLRTSGGVAESYMKEHCNHHELERALAVGNLVRIPSGSLRIPESRFFVCDSIISDLV